MSYILDALKKSQADQQGDAVTVAMTSAPRRDMSLWVWVLAGALVINLIVLAWFIWDRTDAPLPTVVAADPERPHLEPSQDPAPSPTLELKPALEQVPTRETLPSRELSEETPVAEPDLPRDDPVVVDTPPPTPPVDEVALDDLSPGDALVYASFNITSHIYTEDHSAREVIIDGQKLKEGDAFKGLKIYEITEMGLVFEERRRDVIRRVTVNPFDF